MIVFKGEVRPGNSGGPLLTPAGRVIGLVFGQANLPAIYRKAGEQSAARASKRLTGKTRWTFSTTPGRIRG